MSKKLGKHSVSVLRAIIAHVRHHASTATTPDRDLVTTLQAAVARADSELRRDAQALTSTVHRAIGVGSSLTLPDDVIMTPLPGPSAK